MASPRVIDMVDNQPLESPDADVTRVRLPNIKENEMFGIADQLLGASKIKVMCEDVDYYVPVAEVEKLEKQHFDEINKAGLKNGN